MGQQKIILFVVTVCCYFPFVSSINGKNKTRTKLPDTDTELSTCAVLLLLQFEIYQCFYWKINQIRFLPTTLALYREREREHVGHQEQ